MEKPLPTTLELDMPVALSLKSINVLEETLLSCKKLENLPKLHTEADRRIVSARYVRNRPTPGESEKVYSVIDYKGETFLKGDSYTIKELEKF